MKKIYLSFVFSFLFLLSVEAFGQTQKTAQQNETIKSDSARIAEEKKSIPVMNGVYKYESQNNILQVPPQEEKIETKETEKVVTPK